MTQFKITKRVGLDHLGEDWKDCFLEFSAVTFAETKKFALLDTEDEKKAADEALELLKSHFLSGTAIGAAGEKVEVKADELDDFPPDVIASCIKVLAGELPKNA